jgi:Helix-turn-helix domain
MIKKKILNPNRIRRINGGFSFIPHRFLTDGFLASLEQKELLLFLFLVIVSDRNGLSFYSYDAICSLLQLNVDQYIKAKDGLIQKDLIAFDGSVFQVLDLPSKPVLSSRAKQDDQQPTKNLSDIAQLVDQTTKRF